MRGVASYTPFEKNRIPLILPRISREKSTGPLSDLDCQKDGIGMDSNALARQHAVWYCLRWLSETPRTEAEFSARMQALPESNVVLLIGQCAVLREGCQGQAGAPRVDQGRHRDVR